jgi:hypothetical protein
VGALMVTRKKWVKLWEAIQVVVQLGDDGDRLASIMTSSTWASYNHPTSIEAIHGLEWVDLFPLAHEAFNSAIALLRELLPQGMIRGDGVHEDTRKRGPITEQEWEHRYIDFWKSELQHEQFGTRRGQPWITDVLISAVDVRAECRKSLADKKADKTPVQLSDDDARPLIRAAMVENGGAISQEKGANIVLKRDPGFGKKRAMALVKEVTGNDKPGPKGPRKNRAANRA